MVAHPYAPLTRIGDEVETMCLVARDALRSADGEEDEADIMLHSIGDGCLELLDRLRAVVVREHDALGRVGAAEDVVLLRDLRRRTCLNGWLYRRRR